MKKNAPGDRHRGHAVFIRLRAGEVRRLDARAKKAGLTRAALVRRLIAGKESATPTPFEQAMGLWGDIFARKGQLVALLSQLAPHELGILTSVAADDQDTLLGWLPDKASGPLKQAGNVLLGRIPSKLAIDISYPAHPPAATAPEREA